MEQIALAIVPNAYNTYCTFAGSGINSLDANSWIQITGMVLAINFSIAAVLYALSGILPTTYREKLKGAVKYEAFQGIISSIILLILIASSAGLCNVGQALVYGSTVQHYQNPITFSENYVSNLMFNTGLSLFGHIYSESILLTLTGNIADSLEQLLPEITITPAIGFTFGVGLLGIFYGFGGALTSTFLGLIAVTFGILFMVFLILPFIQQLAFTVVLPLALVMRSIPFAGPNLRQTSDTFLALAIGFYFIFPLTILMNGFIMTWIYTGCVPAGAPPALCNPYQQYSGAYQLNNIPTSPLFSTATSRLTGNGFIGGTQLPNTFYSGAFQGLGGLGSGIAEILKNLVDLPNIIIGFGQQTAQYLFEGIFLIGLDFAITVSFAMGLSKGLNSIGRMLGVGPFWGNY
jgi:hypothetical protein